MYRFGMGDVSMTPDDIASCTKYYWLLPIPCWSLSPSAWQSAAALNPSLLTPTPPSQPVATPSNPTPLTMPPASAEDAQATVDATVAASTAASQENILAAVQTQQSLLPSDACSETIISGVCDVVVYIAGALLAGVVLMSAIAPRGRR